MTAEHADVRGSMLVIPGICLGLKLWLVKVMNVGVACGVMLAAAMPSIEAKNTRKNIITISSTLLFSPVDKTRKASQFIRYLSEALATSLNLTSSPDACKRRRAEYRFGLRQAQPHSDCTHFSTQQYIMLLLSLFSQFPYLFLSMVLILSSSFVRQKQQECFQGWWEDLVPRLASAPKCAVPCMHYHNPDLQDNDLETCRRGEPYRSRLQSESLEPQMRLSESFSLRYFLRSVDCLSLLGSEAPRLSN